MNNIIETNVLIVGKSGVGKSSLLNYLFGEKKMETGSGEPVTEKGVFTHKLEIGKDFVVNITDTWGLEADKSEEWKNLIKEDIKKHDKKGIKDWYHSILFCISAKGARIEEFEKNIIKELIDSGNRVVVILTHADVNNVEEAIESIKKELVDLGVKERNILKVGSVEKKLLSGKKVNAFGKEEVLESIKFNLWDIIIEKFPYRTNEIIEESIDEWCRRSIEYSNKHIKWHNSKKINKRIERYIELGLEIEISDIQEKLNKEYSDMVSVNRILMEDKNSENKNSIEKIEEDFFKIQLNLEERFKKVLMESLKDKSLKSVINIKEKKNENINKMIVKLRHKVIEILKENNKEEIFKIQNLK